VRVSWYPVMPVEKTISPTVRPRAAYARPTWTYPSSRTRTAGSLSGPFTAPR